MRPCITAMLTVGLLLASGAVEAQPASAPATPSKAVGEVMTQLSPHIPTGWSIGAAANIITIARQKPIEWYNPISLPAFRGKADLKTMGFVHTATYTITLEIGPPQTPEEVAKLVEENRTTAEDYYKHHAVDSHGKPPSTPKELTDMLHPIPNILTPHYSALLSTFADGGSTSFYNDNEAEECLRVERAVRRLIEPRSATQPAPANSDASPSR